MQNRKRHAKTMLFKNIGPNLFSIYKLEYSIYKTSNEQLKTSHIFTMDFISMENNVMGS